MRHDPPSHHKKQVILIFLFRAAVVSPMSGLRVMPVALTAQSAQAPISLVPTTIVIDPMNCTFRFDVFHD